MKKSIVRVKSGKFSGNAVCFNLPEGEIVLTCDKIKFISLGMIKEEVSIKAEMSGLRKKLRQILLGENKDTQKKIPEIKTSYFIDIFLKDENKIYRFDSSYINYKDFLDAVEFISLSNFKKFALKLKEILKNIETTPCFNYFCQNIPDKMLTHDSVFDFEIYNANYAKKLDFKSNKEDKSEP